MVTSFHCNKKLIVFLFSDNIISIHDLTVYNFPLLSTMNNTKGASVFDLEIKVSICVDVAMKYSSSVVVSSLASLKVKTSDSALVMGNDC